MLKIITMKIRHWIVNQISTTRKNKLISPIWAIYHQVIGTWQEDTVPPRFKRADTIEC